MIERIVLIKLVDAHATPDGRAEVVRRTRDALPGLPGVRAVTVGIPTDEERESRWDICIRVRFTDIEDVEPYLLNPDHRAYVDDFLKPRMEVIKAWNFRVAYRAEVEGDERTLVLVAQCDSLEEAQLVRGLLRAEGIPVHIMGEHHRGMLGMVGATVEPGIMVPSRFEHQAIRLLEKISTSQSDEDFDLEDLEEEEGTD